MSSNGAPGLVIAGCVLAVAGYFGYQKWQDQQLPDSPVAAESADDKEARVAAAFAASASVDDEQVHAFVAELQKAVRQGDNVALGRMVDPGRMLDAVEATSGQRMPKAARSMVEAQLSARLSELFDATVVQTDVKRVDRDAEGNLVVYLRMVDDQRVMLKARWWLYHDGDRLRWWDSEDLQLGLRVSAAMSVGVSAATDAGARPNLERFMEVAGGLAHLEMVDGPPMRQFAADLDALDTRKLPRSFQHMAVAARATAALVMGDAQDTIARLDALEGTSLEPLEMPVRHFLRANAALTLERWDMAASAAQAYLGLLGEDSEAYTQLGQAQLGREDFAAALGAFQKGIADDPHGAENYAGVAQASDDDAVIQAQLRLAPGPQLYEQAAQVLLDGGDALSLSRLVAAAHVVDPSWDVAPWEAHIAALAAETG